MNDKHDEPRCSFCGRPQDEVQKLIAGPGVYICDECVAVAQHIIEEEKDGRYRRVRIEGFADTA